MKDLYSPETITFDPRFTGTLNLTLDWFANKSFYPPRAGVTVEPLVNGQAAFGAVNDAIDNAQHSVDVITWGFDPAMRLKRPEGLRVGELLAAKGKQGVKVRVLVWRNLIANFVENTLPGAGLGGSGGTAMGSGILKGDAAENQILLLDQRRTQNRIDMRGLRQDLLEAQHYQKINSRSYDPVFVAKANNRLLALEAENAEIERLSKQAESAQGYNKLSGSGGTQQDPWGQIYTRDWFKDVNSARMVNVEFRTRDFDGKAKHVMAGDQRRIVRGRLDFLYDLLAAEGITDLGVGQMALLTLFASHHQKMVLVDYGTPQAIGFVMGHNLHRNYWDTDAHLFDDRSAGRDLGFGPWQDISMKVNGPVLTDLSQNFSQAWDLEKPWYNRWFGYESLQVERNTLPVPNVATRGAHSVAQVCRTQPQDKETSILEHYLKAIGNATDYVYMENQYFRYPDFAKRLGDIAKTRKARGVPGDLHLFVVTNTPDSKTASVTTYEMLQALGQEQLMPQVQRDLSESLSEYHAQLDELNNHSGAYSSPFASLNRLKSIERLNAKIQALRDQGITTHVEERMRGIQPDYIPGLAEYIDENDDKPYHRNDIPGLKVVIATLSTSDPAPGSPPPIRLSPEAEAILNAPRLKARYKHIYVHSKLLLVDDVYTLLSSANINIRSMHSDLELGIAQPNPELAKSLREKLRGMHVGEVKASTIENYKHWNEQMDNNWRAQVSGESLMCHLLRFWDVVTPYSPNLTVD
ncbi:phospholipase D-like domain-containing protein [Pseudomonas psychrophila]|uniref:phospholipase D-like domain-containing protein n=1 Tax=Pseudomonas psychrophila TaxID=122355 RepID=UPI0002FB2BD5|nr:phospholipase D-like domain-containing protein [Pseudomonas psychrophila]